MWNEPSQLSGVCNIRFTEEDKDKEKSESKSEKSEDKEDGVRVLLWWS